MTINLNFVLLAVVLFAAAVLATPTEMDDNSRQAKTPGGLIETPDAPTDGRRRYHTKRSKKVKDLAAGRSGYDITKA